MKIPRDAWHRPLLHEDLTPNKKCGLWESTQLEPYLAYYYPECYNYLKLGKLILESENSTHNGDIECYIYHGTIRQLDFDSENLYSQKEIDIKRCYLDFEVFI